MRQNGVVVSEQGMIRSGQSVVIDRQEIRNLSKTLIDDRSCDKEYLNGASRPRVILHKMQ